MGSDQLHPLGYPSEEEEDAGLGAEHSACDLSLGEAVSVHVPDEADLFGVKERVPVLNHD